MRLIKLAAISLAVLFIIVTGISLLIPSHIRISRAINMMADKDSIMAQLANPVTWREWYAGQENSDLLYIEGKIKGVIANPITNAIIVIDTVTKDEVVTLLAGGRKPIISGWKVMNVATSDSTIVQWYMDMQLSWYPWEKFSSLLFEKSFGPAMEEGLTRLRRRVQKNEIENY